MNDKMQVGRLAVEMEEREKVERYLRSFAQMNDGAGPVVPVAFATKLRAFGIDKGFVESKPVPSDKPMSDGARTVGRAAAQKPYNRL